jgi:hypothetical protein
LPGIYLTVAWWFTLPLIMDKRLDFWSAMELSRKVVTRHWWKFLGFCIVLLLLKLAGLVVFCIGFLIAGPIVMASLMYAYEDIFGAAGRAAGEPVADVGPAGTQVLGSTPGQAPNSGGGTWRLVSIGAGVAMLLIVAVVIVLAALKLHHRYRNNQEARVNNLASPVRQLVFGPVIERTIQARATGTNQFLDLDTGTLLTPSSEITGVLVAGQSGNDERLYWEALDIPGDSRRFQYIAWLHESGADLMFAGEGRIIGFDAVFPLAHGDSSMNRESWDSLRPEQVSEAVNVVDWGRRASEASRQGQPVPPGPTSGGTVNSAVQLSQYPDGATVNLLTREQSAIWFFKTREGAMGVLQILGFTDDPDGVKIRYKLVQQTSLAQNDPTNAANPTETFNARENLAARLEAAEMMSNIGEKDKSIAAITLDAAKAGEVEIVTRSLQQISNVAKCGETAHESARLLARRGLRKQAIQIANTINNIALRDQALSELAREDPNKPN